MHGHHADRLRVFSINELRGFFHPEPVMHHALHFPPIALCMHNTALDDNCTGRDPKNTTEHNPGFKLQKTSPPPSFPIIFIVLHMCSCALDNNWAVI